MGRIYLDWGRTNDKCILPFNPEDEILGDDHPLWGWGGGGVPKYPDIFHWYSRINKVLTIWERSFTLHIYKHIYLVFLKD